MSEETQSSNPEMETIEERKENPLLKKIQFPGRKFRLPSKGVFYNDGELDPSVIDGEVEVFPMTAIDEINLKSPELLFEGTAIDRVFKRCIPEVKKPLKLLTSDVDYLLACLRIVSYGKEMHIKHQCAKCKEEHEERKETKIEALYEQYKEEIENDEEAKAQVEAKANQIREETLQPQEYTIDLESILTNKTVEVDENTEFEINMSNGQVIMVSPASFDNTVILYQFYNEDIANDVNKTEEFIVFILASSIKSVDGITDRDNIIEWARHLPVQYKNELSEKIENVGKFGPDFTYHIQCPNCGSEEDVSASLNPVAFFT